MPRHASGHRVDAETDIDAGFPQFGSDARHRVLRLGDGHAVARNDDHFLRVLEHFGHFFGGCGLDFARPRRRRRGSASRAEAAHDDADEPAVHGAAHDVAQYRAAGADQGAGDDQQVVGQHESRRRGRPSGVAVQHGDHDRHVGAADGHDHVYAEGEGDDRHDDEREHARTD